MKNALWLFSERIVSMVGGLLITIYTAKYLGPENMGEINYALAIGAFVVPLAQLGSQTLIFDKTVKSKVQGAKLIMSSQVLRRVIFIAVSIVIYLFVQIGNSESYNFILIGILLSFYYTSMDSYKPYFDGLLESKVNSVATQLGLLFSHILRLALVVFSAPLVFFCIPYVVYTAVPYFIKKYKFKCSINSIQSQNKQVKKYRDFSVSAGLPLALSGLSVIVYMKMSQIILGQFEGMHEVGIYGAASTLAQAWVFIPITIMTVLLSKVLNDRDNKFIGFGFVHLICICISLVFVVFSFFFKAELINYSFGSEYNEAIEIIDVLTVSSLFVVCGTIGYRVTINMGGYKFLMKKMFMMAIFNVALSFLLIRYYGIVGAAYSVLITEVVSATIAAYFFKSGYIYKVHTSLFFSVSYWKCYAR